MTTQIDGETFHETFIGTCARCLQRIKLNPWLNWYACDCSRYTPEMQHAGKALFPSWKLDGKQTP